MKEDIRLLDKFINDFEDFFDKQESYNQTEEHRKLIAMESEEYDKFMCERFPAFFAQRSRPMTETCMCWGFEIGCGWYPVLFELCERLEVLCTPYKLDLQFEQIKEKFGSGRFYYSLGMKNCTADDKTLSVVNETIRDLISEYENKCDQICALTGRHYRHKISTGWIHDICIEAWVELYKDNPTQKQVGIDVVNYLKNVDKVKQLLYSCDFQNVKNVLTYTESLCKKR